MTGPSPATKVPAVDQALQILRLLTRGPIPAGRIAAQLALPRSTVYHLLAALKEHGFVMHLPEEHRYGLGLAAVELSSAYSKQEPLTHLGRPLVAALVDRVHASGHLAVPHGRDVLYVIDERAAGAPTLVTGVDVRLPMHLTASGRAILAALPRAQVRALYPTREAFASRLDLPGGIDGYSALRAELDATTARGYSVEVGSITPGFSSVAVPVLDHRCWPIAAIAVTFREEEQDEQRYPVLAAEVRLAADLLSTRLHGRTPDADLSGRSAAPR